jgi:DNA-binding protein H-NS
MDKMRAGTMAAAERASVVTPIQSLTDTRIACVVLLGADVVRRSTDRSVQRRVHAPQRASVFASVEENGETTSWHGSGRRSSEKL